MAIPFDTLGYSKALKSAGVEPLIAEAHAEAARDFIMKELVTKADLQTALSAIDAKLDAQTLRITARMGAMMALGIGLLGALIRLA